jgi:HlyD family secretion protein
MQKLKSFIAGHKKTSIALMLIIIFGGYYTYSYFKPVGPSKYVLALAKKDTIVSSVSGAGQVLAESVLTVKPSLSGTLTSVYVSNGDSVREGQVLAKLDQRAASISLAQARSSLQSAQASYDKIINGSTAVDLQVTQTTVDNAKQDLVNKILNSFTQVDNIIRTNVDQLYKDPDSYITPQFQLSFFDSAINSAVILTIKDQGLSLQLGSERQHITAVMKSYRQVSESLSSSSTNDDVKKAALQTEGYLKEVKVFLTDLAEGVNSFSYNTSKYKTNVESYKTSVASARTSVDNLLSDLGSTKQNLISSENQLLVKKTPARNEDITSAQAQLDSARASLQSAQNSYANNIIIAPFDGVIAGMTANKGDQVSSSASLLTLVTKTKIAQIPFNEVDASHITVGQKVTLTFDALPELTISGKVIEVDPLGTVSQGVVTYNVKIGFDTQDDRIKPNMSVSASIITSVKQDVVTVPNEAVKTKNGVSKVSVASGIATSTASDGILLDVAPTEVEVQIGVSNNKVTEIISGITEGQAVVTKTIAATSATTASAQSGLSLLGGNTRGGAGGTTRGLGR